jgi:DNA-directed RNA polymerase specialized sigma24 family protein
MSQTLDEMCQFMTDGLITYLANSEPNDEPRNNASTVTNTGTAQVLARQSHRDCLALQFWEVAQRALDHLTRPTREAFFHKRREGERHDLLSPCGRIRLAILNSESGVT